MKYEEINAIHFLNKMQQNEDKTAKTTNIYTYAYIYIHTHIHSHQYVTVK